jgi:hypothetical protein
MPDRRAEIRLKLATLDRELAERTYDRAVRAGAGVSEQERDQLKTAMEKARLQEELARLDVGTDDETQRARPRRLSKGAPKAKR